VTVNVGYSSPWLRGYGSIIVVLLGLVIVGAGVVAVSDGARRQAAISFVPVPERFTELYVAEQRPVEVVDGPAGETVGVRFTIANHEGHSQTLRYTVRVVDGAEFPLGASTGSATIGDTGVATVNSTVALPAAAPWSAVEVTLDGRSEKLRLLRAQADPIAP
jgi:uncharacterized membrane protein